MAGEREHLPATQRGADTGMEMRTQRWDGGSKSKAAGCEQGGTYWVAQF